MYVYMLKSKIQGLRVTDTELHYEGSITLDREILEKSGIFAGEQVHVLNLNNGSRIITYTIEAPRGTGSVILNGPAARMGMVGDPLFVLAYGLVNEKEARSYKPTIILYDANND